MTQRVVIVGARSGTLELLSSLIEADGSRRIVGSTGHNGAIAALLHSARADLVLVNLSSEGAAGLRLLERVRRAVAVPVVALLPSNASDDEIQLARELGAAGATRAPSSSDQAAPTARAFRAALDRAARLQAAPDCAAPASPRSRRGPAEAGPDPVAPPLSCPAPALPKRRRPAAASPLQMPPSATRNLRRPVIAVGASTGGTQTTLEILETFPHDAPAVLVVQHISEPFARAYAKRLDENCQMNARIARDGDAVERGRILVAPGNEHMTLARVHGRLVVRVQGGPKVEHQRPSVDVLFHSVASILRKQAVGVLLTGMGKDGAEGLLAMRQNGAYTIAQDEHSSIVYGMPRAAALLNAAARVLPLDKIARETLRACAA